MPTHYDHDANAKLDYSIDWSSWLPEGDTIDEVTWSADAGLTLSSQSLAEGVATVWVEVAAGVPVGSVLRATCRATTTQGRKDDRSLIFTVVSN